MHNRFFISTALGLLASYMLASCSDSDGVPPVAEPTVCDTGSFVTLPDNFPTPEIPCNNQLNAFKIQLGRFLFYDRNISFNQTQSCADCHQQDKAFTDGLMTSIGSEGAIHPRNAMSMTNVVYNATQNWANNLITDLDQQALAVLLNEAPIELGWTGHEDEILDRLRNPDPTDYAATPPDYPALFTAAFSEEEIAITIDTATKAISAFGSTMVSVNSAFDKNQRGESSTMSEAAKRGRDLFNGERLECFHCHGGFNFSESVDHTGLQFTQISFHNNALYNIDVTGDGIGDGNYPADNHGLREFTLESRDEGKFRPPTLRNIELTGPYMHDGSIATLDEVIDHYARGGREILIGPNAGDGALNPNKSSFINGFVITAQERLDLIEFFNSLTDWDFICNPDLSDPFGNLTMHPVCP